MSNGSGGGQDALLRLLAAQQQLLWRGWGPGGNGMAASALPSTSFPQMDTNASSVAATMAATQGLLWQAMLAQAALSTVSSQSSTTPPVSRQGPVEGTFEEALAKLAAAANQAPKGQRVSGNGSASVSSTTEQLEPGEIPRNHRSSNHLRNNLLSSLSASSTSNACEPSSSRQNSNSASLSLAQLSPSASLPSSSGTTTPASVRLASSSVAVPSSSSSAGRTGTPLNLSSSRRLPSLLEDSEGSRRRQPTTDATLVRIPLQHGWRRQTCVREMNAAGIKGDVVYFAPCGRKINSYSECIRYLQKHTNEKSIVSRELFTFSTKVIVGEFIVMHPTSEGENKGVINLTEDDMNGELKRLNEEKMARLNEERERREKPLREKKEAIAREREERKEAKRREREQREKAREAEKEEKRRLEEENEAARQLLEAEGLNKRAPVEDLLLEEIRPLPEFSRIANLELTGSAFADALMVVEFLDNFASVLDIDKASLPSIGSLCAGLSGDTAHSAAVTFTVHVLLSRALKLPKCRKTVAGLGRSLGSVPLSDCNRDELLRLFLRIADPPGKELSLGLESSSFHALPSPAKAAILGCLVNEVNCCEQIINQIDTSLEELARLKGDRWMREGKIRALRGVQERKRARPSSRSSERSDATKEEEMKEKEKKNLTPGIGQCEVLTAEEEEMGVEEIEGVIGELGEEAEALRGQIHEVNARVRVFPFGEDRFHRHYWQLRSGLPVLVESIESAASLNPACDLSICDADPPGLQLPADVFVNPDVAATVEDLLDAVTSGRSERERKRRGPAAYRKMGNAEKRGWWTVRRSELETWRSGLHGRGIRERALHRLLLRDKFTTELHLGELSIEPVRSELSSDTLRAEYAERLSLQLTTLEERCRVAGFCDPNPSSPSNGFSHGLDPLSVEALKERIAGCEASIDRKFIRDEERQQTPSVKDETETEDKEEREEKEESAEKEREEKEERAEKEREREQDDDSSSSSPSNESPILTWRLLLASATTVAQISLALELLDELIAWESSAVCWFCSVCRRSSSRSPSSSQLVRCVTCSSSAHSSCISSPAERVNWRCPRCCQRALAVADAEAEEEEGGAGEILEELATAGDATSPAKLPPPRPLKRRAEPGSFVVPPDKVAELARAMLDELEQQKGVGPFLAPVDLEEVPEYAVVIAKPIDLGTIRNRVDDGWYDSAEDFVADVELLFNNCHEFNEDSSEIGQAGLSLHKFFNKRWRQLKYNLSKRVKRIKEKS